MNVSTPTVTYDICGQICPSALLTALQIVARHKEDLKQGKVSLCFKTDNRNATQTIPQTVTNMGYYAEVSKLSECYQIIIRH